MSLINKFKQSLFLKNFSYLVIGNVTARAINMVTNVILARWLEPTGYGLYSLILTYISIFSVVASLGMQYITNKYVARNQDYSKKYLYICFTIRFFGYALAVLTLFIYNTASLKLEAILLYALLLGIFCDSLWGGLQSVAFGMQRMQWNSIIDVSTSVITLCIYLILQFIDSNFINVRVVIWIYVVIYFIKNIVYWLTLKYTHLIRGNVHYKSIEKQDFLIFLKEGIPFYVLSLMGLFTNQFPIVFLQNHSGLNEVAYFNTANKLLMPLTILLSTALTALFPNQSQLYVKNHTKFWQQAHKMFFFILFVGSIFSFIISVYRNEIVWILYGDKYKNTGSVMAFQCWYIVMFAFFSLNGNILGASDKQKLLMIESIIYAIITTPIIFWGSYHGAVGLALAYVIASVLNIIYLYAMLYKISGNIMTIRSSIRSIVVMACFALISFLTPVNWSIFAKTLFVVLILLITYKIYEYKTENQISEK